MSRFALLLPLLFIAAIAQAKGPAYTNPDKADADYARQGEYVGTVKTSSGDLTLAVQIIALGEGKFNLVGYHGGLPGAGWNGEEKQKTSGELADDGTVTFKDDHGVGVLKDGALHVTLKGQDKPSVELKKVNRQSPTLGAKPPKGAVVLFDGSEKSLENWNNGKLSDDGHLMQGVTSKPTFGSHKLHLEFRLPYQPLDRGQGRGNSGCYVQGRYEVQMLDSFGLEGEQNECGGIYSVAKPSVNMCLPPLTWQTYDIEYTAAEYDGDKLVKNPRITVQHNGVTIHDDVELPGNRNTTAAPLKAGKENGPVYLQNHGNPVRYRNIWVVER